MTRRSSVRAQARRNYRDLAAKAAPQKATPSPKNETDLTARVRALYEDSAVPVAKIAALAGVTERTIYKYVAKRGWKRRYCWAPPGSDQDLAAAPRGRRWRPSPNFAPAKGAGSRFIRREDKDKPIAVGLKATDPGGASHAAAACGRAALLAALAQAKAEQAQRSERRIRAIDCTNGVLKNLRAYREARKTKGLRGSGADRIEQLLMFTAEAALKGWEALVDDDERLSASAAQSERRTPAADADHK